MVRLLRCLAAAALLCTAFTGCLDGAPATSQNQDDVSESTGRFELFVGDDGQHYFHLLAKNGECLIRSQAYSSLSSAKSGITSVKSNGLIETRFAVLKADDGESYFNLKASNGKVIATSETYSNDSGAKTGVQAVIKALAKPASATAAGGAGFETFKGQDGKTYFRLRADNGQIVLQSQGYSSKSAAQGGIDSVEANGADATSYEIVGGINGQHTFHMTAANGKIIARGEMYSSKSNAIRGAGRVREIVRDLGGEGAVSDAEVKAEIEKAFNGMLFMSEGDYPYQYVTTPLAAGAAIDQALIRAKLAAVVDADPAADKPLSALNGMENTWQQWKDQAHACADLDDPDALVGCNKMRNLEQVLESNLTDIHVFYFGKKGKPGTVDGVGVSVFIVGKTPSGQLAGIRTLAIWT